MPDLGKADSAFFDQFIYPHLGADRDEVRVEPAHGVDFGAVEIGGQMLAIATDPVSINPGLGLERAGWLALHILLSDVAVSGLDPAYLSIDLNLPPEIENDTFEAVWSVMDREARKFGVQVVTGHTARYQGCNYPMVGGGTAMAVGDPEDLVRPDGARPGDSVIVTKGPAVEAVGVLSVLFADQVVEDLSEADLAAAQDRFYDSSPVEDAIVAANSGPMTAMHDATEGGVIGGFHEMARAAGVQFEIERDAIPVLDGIRPACEAFGIDPWISISEGTLLGTVDQSGVDAVLGALADAGVPAAEVGVVSEGSGLIVDGERVDHPGADPYWQALEECAARAED
ncbi:AIR synthase family protein [Halococcoides cellulosivorans]|uniref:Hydrogenase expression protein n=1 Tax=Halococcoides cellulosivorans TaxID=1679096 RepID=A0A2R4WZ35_9EURY|nr:AIR synthase family protein [Halococcoides cellulosivorans]AWB26775.1 hydrogenase expression protein [Halococcoides cellulosivorans]